jgi:hypothetical protein
VPSRCVLRSFTVYAPFMLGNGCTSSPQSQGVPCASFNAPSVPLSHNLTLLLFLSRYQSKLCASSLTSKPPPLILTSRVHCILSSRCTGKRCTHDSCLADEKEVDLGNRAREPHEVEDFDDSANALWSLYVKEAKSHDEATVETIKDDMDGALIFVRLYTPTRLQARLC